MTPSAVFLKLWASMYHFSCTTSHGTNHNRWCGPNPFPIAQKLLGKVETFKLLLVASSAVDCQQHYSTINWQADACLRQRLVLKDSCQGAGNAAENHPPEKQGSSLDQGSTAILSSLWTLTQQPQPTPEMYCAASNMIWWDWIPWTLCWIETLELYGTLDSYGTLFGLR